MVKKITIYPTILYAIGTGFDYVLRSNGAQANIFPNLLYEKRMRQRDERHIREVQTTLRPDIATTIEIETHGCENRRNGG